MDSVRELFEIFALWFPGYDSMPSDEENGESGSDLDDDPELGPASGEVAVFEAAEDEGLLEHGEDTW